MELCANKEGMHYILGSPLENDPVLFSQVILSAGDLDWFPSVGTVAGFSSLADVQRAKEELQDHLAGPLCVYKVTIEPL